MEPAAIDIANSLLDAISNGRFEEVAALLDETIRFKRRGTPSADVSLPDIAPLPQGEVTRDALVELLRESIDRPAHVDRLGLRVDHVELVADGRVLARGAVMRLTRGGGGFGRPFAVAMSVDRGVVVEIETYHGDEEAKLG